MNNAVALLKRLSVLGIKLDLDQNENLVVRGEKKLLTPELIGEMKANKTPLLDILKQHKNYQQKDVIPQVSRSEALPSSFAQQRLWLLDKIDGGSSHYHIPAVLRLSGVVEEAAIAKSFTSIIERHESLRTVFIEDDKGEPIQVIQPMVEGLFHVGFSDVSEEEAGKKLLSLTTLVGEISNSPFDLSTDVMLRARLVKQNEQDYVLLVTMHHIASDGWSIGILINEFCALYQAYSEGKTNPLAPLAIQYGDYAHWQRHYLQGEVLEQQLSYWQTQLQDLPTVHQLPLDKTRPSKQTFVGRNYASSINQETTNKLNALCQAQGATLFMGLQAAFSVLLARYSNETDIVVGSPIANREQAEVAPLIGFFVNTLVLRSDLSNNPSFTELLLQSKNTLLDAYAHQQVPFEQLVETLKPERSMAHSPLFQVMLVLQNNEQVDINLPGLTLSPYGNNTEQTEQAGQAKYDLTLNISEDEKGLSLSWNYNSDLFVEASIAAMTCHFSQLVSGLLNAPKTPVFEIDILNTKETQQQLITWNDTQKDYPKNLCIHQLFEQQAELHPNNIAVVFEESELTYQVLNEQANQLAAYLKAERGITPDTLVGLCVERSLDMVVGILAILKAGGAYVPLDPDYPQARLAYMVEDAKLETILTTKTLLNITPTNKKQAVCLDDESHINTRQTYSTENIANKQLTPQHLAYVIYTSGSTGQPKGVMVEHQSISNLAVSIQRLNLSEDNTTDTNNHWGWMASYAFDASVQGLTQLVLGQSLCIIPQVCKQDIAQLTPHLSILSVIDCTPVIIEQWFEAGLDNQLPNLIIGGDAISQSLWEKLVAWQQATGKKALNVYGPTEATVNSTYTEISGQYPNIGRGLNNTHLAVLDNNEQLTPQGVAGELHIGGAGLARGYLNQPALTAIRFIANPFYDETKNEGVHTSKRLYKTGDLVRWLSDGTLEFLGRLDHQVKIRGFRIELGEIEHQLASQDSVNDAIVLAKTTEQGDKHLVAYITTLLATSFSEETEENQQSRADYIDGLRQALSITLPGYMVPAAFMLLESFPLTASGKVDRKALPDADITSQQQVYVAPTTETEIALCEIWQDVLGVEQVGITDNFFALGGHSLLATKLISLMNTKFSITLPLKSLFEQQSIELLSDVVLSAEYSVQQTISRVSRDQSLPSSFAQQRLWLLDKIDGGSSHYHIPAALHLSGVVDEDAIAKSFKAIIERHESLRTVFIEDGNGEPIQVIHPVSDDLFNIGYSDLSDEDAGKKLLDLTTLIGEIFNTPFDLSTDMMLRVQLVKQGEQDFVLLVTMHHIASDGWSIGVLISEFCTLYQAYTQGLENPLPSLAIQYGDYAHWQRNHLQGDVLDKQLSYWQKQLQDLPTVHQFPLDKARPSKQSFVGKNYASRLNKDLTTQLNNLCQKQGATLFMGIQAAFSVLIARYSNETDIVMGSPIANREQAEVAPLIGFFVNSLVLRSDLTGNPSFLTLLSKSKTMLLGAYEHQQVPFEQLVEVLKPERSMSHSPLFQVMLVLQNNEQSELDLPGLTLSPYGDDATIIAQAKYDLTLNITEDLQGLSLNWNYNRDLFDDETIRTLAEHFKQLVTAFMASPQSSVFEAKMLDETDIHQQLVTWNNTQASYPDDLCVHQLFESQALQHPDNIAVVLEEKSLTFQVLNEQANQLAAYLIAERNVLPDTLVGLCVERSFDMIIAILAILKAGGAYVPLDPDYPQARLAYMIDDAKLTTILTTKAVLGNSAINIEHALCLDNGLLQEELNKFPTKNFAIESLTAQHLAYVIYTSGSTGQPKGVMIEHQGVVSLAVNNGFIEQSAATVMLQNSPIVFDAATFEIWGTLLNAGKLVLQGDPQISMEQLGNFINQHKINTALLTSGLFDAFISLYNSPLKDLRTLLVGGDIVNSENIRKIKEINPYLTAVNIYGPTENTTISSTYQMEPFAEIPQQLPIGCPLYNRQVCVLSDQLALVPIGTIGELHVGGAGLARGYVNLTNLTAERFIANPFYNEAKTTGLHASPRLYKTGDLVRWLSDGTLEFLGRIDHQVKIRGFRIELGEIEHQLASQTNVNDAIVLSKTSDQGDKQLVAYLTTPFANRFAEETEQNQQERADYIDVLRQNLLTTLPSYMVPAVFVLLELFPLTSNGKVDRKALPDADITSQQQVYVAPSTETEKSLCEIWQDLLGIERVGVNDDFFALGGHSLQIMKLLSAIRAQFAIEVSVAQLFELKKITDCATHIDNLNVVKSMSQSHKNNNVKEEGLL